MQETDRYRMNTAINKELLFIHFEGRTTPLQIELLREWLQNSDNQQLYYQWLQEWERQHPQIITDPDVAYNQFQQKIRNISQPAAVRRTTGWNRWKPGYYFAAASVTALLLVLGYLTRSYWAVRTLATDYGEVRSVVLDDGTRVTLNANSELRIPRFTSGAALREVFLWGEAEFAVVHTPSHEHFRVRTANDVEVVVLGTEFVVNTRRNNTRVELNRGKVQLRYPAANQINTLTMQPGDWVNVPVGGQAKRGRKPAEQTTAATWKNYEYAFQRTPMLDIANLLTDNFGIKVQMNATLARRRVTGTFHAHTADELLRALAELFDLDVIHQGESVQLMAADTNQSQ